MNALPRMLPLRFLITTRRQSILRRYAGVQLQIGFRREQHLPDLLDDEGRHAYRDTHDR